MKNKNKAQLLDQLAQYGYELYVPGTPASAPEKVLEALLKQDDSRLLEGFPVVLANALSRKNVLAWENNKWRPGEAFSSKMEERWVVLMAVSYLLFRLFGMEKSCQDRVLKLLKKDRRGGAVLETTENSFSGEKIKADGLYLFPERLKNSFRNYVVHQSDSGEELEAQKNALAYELRLSALFTARQKELLTKRLAGKPMTKTEKEYYSRVVKKRLSALADPRLHQMARALV